MEQVCFDASETIGGIVATVIAIASIVANSISREKWYGKVIHFLAFNFSKHTKPAV